VLQIADSAFPTGGFAHSAGLEAAFQVGHVRCAEDIEPYVRALLWNAGRASLPFVGAAHDAPHTLWTLDALLDARLTNHVANRASRTQGRTFLATCARVFDDEAIAGLAARATSREVAAHLAVSFGAALAALRVARGHVLGLYLLLALRGVTSAGVRLGIVGPHEAQRLQRRHGATLDAVLAECERLLPADAATVAPLFDVFGATHDRLYSRLFQS
jgi:urease accessory protein